LKAAGVNILTVTSSESLDRLTALLIDKGLQEDGRADNREIMQQLSLLTPSQRVAQQAMEAGYTRVYNASGADPASFVAALGELGANQE
jgi:uroporphyrinogen-III synthase